MTFRVLKSARVVVSLLFFAATSSVLLDFLNLLPSGVVRTILFLQFTPSFIHLVSLAGASAFSCILVVILGLLFGRIYCSTICPLGTLQDIISFASRKFRPKKYHEPLQAHSRLHVAFLVVAIVPIVAGSMVGITLLDPFSNFGRLVGTIVRPLIITMNNILCSLLELFDRYDVYPVALQRVELVSIILPLLFLTLIGWTSFQHGRLYCNSICPVGSLLRLISRYSLFKVAIDPDHCKSCQLCQRVCKAGCIDRKRKIVDFERCVDCFNCFAACPSKGLRFVFGFKSKETGKSTVDRERRTFLFHSSLLFLGQRVVADTIKIIRPQKQSTIPERKHFSVTPPGSLSLRHFTETCTACHVCISSCPSHVLQPSTLQYGLIGILQPTMDFDVSYCNFECTACAEVCPSGALRKLTTEEKKLSQAGRVVFIRENCVVYTENTDCGACTEHCPTKAVTMVPYKNSRLPEVDPDYCIGCGACEHACPTRPYKSIYVDGNLVHNVAKKKPPEKKTEVNTGGDFPF